MPTLPVYLGVSQIQNDSPGLPYSSPNLPDKSEFGYFFNMKIKDESKSSKYLQIKKKTLGFLVKDGCFCFFVFLKFYLILVFMHPF